MTQESITMAQFIAEHGLRATIQRADSNPNMGPKQPMNHYKVVIRHESGARMTTYFSTGMGWTHAPSLSDVLDCLASDAYGMESPFESWAEDYGFDPDSRKAERIYKICQRQTIKLKSLLGDSAFEQLIYGVERL